MPTLDQRYTDLLHYNNGCTTKNYPHVGPARFCQQNFEQLKAMNIMMVNFGQNIMTIDC